MYNTCFAYSVNITNDGNPLQRIPKTWATGRTIHTAAEASQRQVILSRPTADDLSFHAREPYPPLESSNWIAAGTNPCVPPVVPFQGPLAVFALFSSR